MQKVTPIHEADYESDNEHDMHDLIEEFEKMDVEWSLVYCLTCGRKGGWLWGYRYKAIINEESQEGDRELSNPIDTIGVWKLVYFFSHPDEILLARHTTDKQLYVLKKLSIKEGNNQALYEGLLN